MKKLKTALMILLGIIAISTIIYFLPLDNITSRIPFLNRFYSNTILEIVSINGKAKVTIDGTQYGETPLTINELDQGDYAVTLERISETSDFYEPQVFTIKLTKNTTSRMEIEIGPAGIVHGSILYYTQQNGLDKDKGSVSVLCETESSKIYLDTEYVKETPLVARELQPKEYDLEVKATNYDPLKVPILIRNGYLLNIKTYLFPIPVNFENIKNE